MSKGMRVSLRPRTERFEQNVPLPRRSPVVERSAKIIPKHWPCAATVAMGSEALRLPETLRASGFQPRHRSAMKRTLARFHPKNQSVAAACRVATDLHCQSLGAEQRMLLLLQGLDGLQEDFHPSNARPFALRP
ncbi:MAG: hypothetical protein VYC39_09275 [Myxococcota bacterium]|nr:hypothetical protein [Myxococcota bacterium]